MERGKQARPCERGLPAPRWANDADEPGFTAQLGEQLPGQQLATEEQRRVLDVKDAKAPVRITPSHQRRSSRWARLDPADPAHQSMDGVGIVEILRELYPLAVRQEPGESAQSLALGAGEEHRN